MAPGAPAATVYHTATEAANAALTYALERRPQEPEWWTCTIASPPGTVTTADTLEYAIRAAREFRQSRVSLTGLAVGLYGWGNGAVSFLVEGLRRTD
jgi:hypothetical protein